MTAADVDPSTLAGGLHADKSGDVIACCVVFAVLCTLFLVLRFVAHHVKGRKPCAEDWVMIPSWFLMMGLCVNAICSVVYGGVGRHEAWVVQFKPQAMMGWAQALFVTEFLYGILIPLEKTSILLLYLRLFRIHKWFRYTSYGLIAYIWAWGISESIVAVVQCMPVEFQWNKSIEGTCIDQLAYFRWVSVPNVIHDVVMLIVPIPIVWNLQIGLRQKFALSTIFAIGSFGCVASFIRMHYFFQLNAFSDRTWASIQLMSWTVAEPGAIFLSACMPALWPLIRLIPGMTSTLTGTKSTGNGTSRSRDLEASGGKSARRSRVTWSRYSRSDNEFIPLHNVDERPPQPSTTTYDVSTAPANSEGPAGERGVISITREYSVTTPGLAK